MRDSVGGEHCTQGLVCIAAIIGLELNLQGSAGAAVVTRMRPIDDQIEVHIADRAGVSGKETVTDDMRSDREVVQGVRVRSRTVKA